MINYLRSSSEAILLFLIVASPWAFGATHPFFRYCIAAGVSLTLLFWSIELLLKPKRLWSWFHIPLLVLTLLLCLQVLPLGGIADMVSPRAAELKQTMLPQQLEVLADGEAAPIPYWSARGRISLYPAETLRRGFWMVLMALLFVRVQDLATVHTLRRLSLACLINGSVLAYFAVFQHFMTDEVGLIYWKYPSLGAAFGPFINRNHFAFYINICFGMSLGYLGSRLMGKIKSLRLDEIVDAMRDTVSLWMASVLVFMLGALILCSSRGGLIGLVGGTLITAIFVSATGSFREGWKWFLMASAIFTVAAGVQIWLGFDFVDSRYADHNDNRTALWLPIMTLAPQFPLGTGLGTLPYIEPLTRAATEQRDFYLEYAHNEYLQVLIELGIPGLLAGVALLVMLFARIAGRIRRSRHNAWLYVGCLFSLSTIALHSFAEFGPRIPAIAILAVVLCGSIAGVGQVKDDQPVGALTGHGILSRLLALGVMVFLVFAMRDAKLFDLAERHLLEAQRARRDLRTEAELEQYQIASSITPNDVELQLEKCRIQFRSDQVALMKDPSNLDYLVYAQKDLVRVRELCPLAAEPHAFIAQHSGLFSKTDPIESYFHRALVSRPNDQDNWYLTGKNQLSRGKKDNAIEHFQTSLSLSSKYLDKIMTLAMDQFSLEDIQSKLIPNDSRALVDAANWLRKKATAKKPAADLASDPTAVEVAAADLLGMQASFRQQALETAELQNPGSADLYVRKAELHRELGELDKATSAYQRAIAYEPRQIKWRFAVAQLLAEQKRYREAHRQIKTILQTKKHKPTERLRDELLRQEAAEK